MADDIDAVGDVSEDQTDARGIPFRSSARAQPTPTMKEADFVSDRYKMNHEDRGVAVIFNHKNFHKKTGMGRRDGTDVDADSMHQLLETLSFEKIRKYDDCTVKEMREILLDIAKDDHSDSDCFVCVILSHGEEGYVYGFDDRVAIDELVMNFKGNMCPSLAGKPKLFFIQACRGTDLMDGVEVADGGPDEEEEMEEDIVVRRIPTEADFLMAYSVVPGFYAWRNSARGSWFVQAIRDVFKENWQKMDVLTMMTRVNKKVAYSFESNASQPHMNRRKQIPCITSMLTKDLFFTKK